MIPQKKWLTRQVESCQAQIQKNKIHAPYLYPEYHELNDAKRKLEEAKRRLELAQKRWDELGF